MQTIKAPPPHPNAAVGITFLHRVGAPEWRLVSEARPKAFPKASAKEASEWIAQQQRQGRPVSVAMPMREDAHWWLQARLSASAHPAALTPPPQWLVVTDTEFIALWRLEQPVSTTRAIELTRRIIGRDGRHAIGEPVPLPGSVVPQRVGRGLFAHVRVMPCSRAPGYRVDGNALVSVMAKATKPARDPRRLAIQIAEGDYITPGTASNGFFLTVGAAGGGKTVALRRIAQDARHYGVPVLVFDFHGDVDVKGTRRVLLSSGAASTIGLNPLEVLTDPEGRRSLHDQIVAFSDLIARAYPVGHLQVNDLRAALAACYAAAGILEGDPATWTRPAPSVAQLIAQLDAMAEEDPKAAKRIGGLLASAGQMFGNPMFRRDPVLTTDELVTGSLHLDLASLGDSEMMVVTETLLLRVFAALKALGPIPENPVDDSERFRLMIVIDEAQKLGSSEVLSMLFKEARKFGLMMNVGTQSASNLPQDVRANSAVWLALMHSDAKEAKATAESVGVKGEDLLALRPKGDGYLRVRPQETRRIQVLRP